MSYKAIFAMLAGGILLAAPASAQGWGRPSQTPRNGACFYEFPNYRGRYICAQAGEALPQMPSAFRDRIGSIRVFGGARVIVYSDNRFDGEERWINYNVPDLQYEGWYDHIGSARLSWEPRYAGRSDDDRPRGTSGYYDGQDNDRDDRGENPRYGTDRPYYPNAPGSMRMTPDEARAIVRAAYLNVLGREPDPASAGWVSRVLNDHWSQQQIENELRNSAEYRSRYGVR